MSSSSAPDAASPASVDIYHRAAGPFYLHGGSTMSDADTALWRRFRASCRREGRTISGTLRLLMRLWLKEHPDAD